VVLSYRDIEHPEAGGAEVIMLEVFARLAAAGHRVTFFTGTFSGGAARTEIRGMDTRRVGNQYTFNFAGPRAVRAFAREEHVDIVVEDINKIPFFTPRLVPDVPTLAVVPHLFGTTVYEQAAWPIATYVVMYERLIPRVYRRCRFSVLSNTISPDRIHVIRAGIDLSLYPRRDPEAGWPPPVITYLGRLKRYKGIDLVIDALPEVRRHVPDVVYQIVGEGDDTDRLAERARERGVADAVRFLGFQSDAEKVPTLAGSRALVYTSPKEGWGLSVIEAAAVGVPTLASDAPGLKESVRHEETGLLVPHGDVAAIEKGLVTLLTDEARWRRFSAAARTWAETFSWDEMAGQTLELTEQIIHESTNPAQTRSS
jgi:glycosyltransferase involved in cell wall biosynthesis